MMLVFLFYFWTQIGEPESIKDCLLTDDKVCRRNSVSKKLLTDHTVQNLPRNPCTSPIPPLPPPQKKGNETTASLLSKKESH